MGDFKSVKLLLEKGANVNVSRVNEGNTPFHLASQTNGLLVIHLLIQASAIVNMINDEGDTALHEATRCVALESVESLLDTGADVNGKNTHGNTPLHIAAAKQYSQFRNMELAKASGLGGFSKSH